MIQVTKRRNINISWLHTVNVMVVQYPFPSTNPVSTIQFLSTSLYACFRRMHVPNMLATQVSPQYHNTTYMYMYYSADRKTMDHSSNWVVLSISDADVIYQKQVWGFHQGFQTPRNRWKHSAAFICFSGVWNPWKNPTHKFLRWLLKRYNKKICSDTFFCYFAPQMKEQ